MNETLEFLGRHGPAILFVVVFIEQMGVPLLGAPGLVLSGALAATGKVNWLVVLSAATLGSITADLIWFYLGRYRGEAVLGVLCRISLEPETCVRRTRDVFTRFGFFGFIVAKVVPSFSTALAGSSGIKASRFFLLDAFGTLLYAGAFMVLGVLFSRQVERVIATLGTLGNGALGALIALVLIYAGYQLSQRHRLLTELRMAWITADELHRRLEADEKPVILDLREHADREQDPSLMCNAVHMTVDEVPLRVHEIPLDQDIVLYCSSPNEIVSARIALMLRRRGVRRVRPLFGGFDAWRQKYPTETCVLGTMEKSKSTNL